MCAVAATLCYVLVAFEGTNSVLRLQTATVCVGCWRWTLCFDMPPCESSHVPCRQFGMARPGTAVFFCVEATPNLLVVVRARSARVGVDNIRVWEETTLAAANKLDEERRKYDEQVCGCARQLTCDRCSLPHAHGPLATRSTLLVACWRWALSPCAKRGREVSSHATPGIVCHCCRL